MLKTFHPDQDETETRLSKHQTSQRGPAGSNKVNLGQSKKQVCYTNENINEKTIASDSGDPQNKCASSQNKDKILSPSVSLGYYS